MVLQNPSDKIVDVEDLVLLIDELKSKKQRIVFTNGCFDLIHTGHIRYLKAARDAGDVLIVAVNSDNSAKQLKGSTRPLIPLEDRMEVLASLYFTDFIVSFDELDPYNVINKLKPNILIKGGDWAISEIIGKDVVEKEGGEVFTIPEIPDRATTNIIEKILKLHDKSVK